MIQGPHRGVIYLNYIVNEYNNFFRLRFSAFLLFLITEHRSSIVVPYADVEYRLGIPIAIQLYHFLSSQWSSEKLQIVLNKQSSQRSFFIIVHYGFLPDGSCIAKVVFTLQYLDTLVDHNCPRYGMCQISLGCFRGFVTVTFSRN